MSERPPEQDVVVRDVQMPFLSMVVFMVKWALAAIPAMLVLLTVALMFGFVAVALLGSLTGVGRLFSQRAREPAVAPSAPPARSSNIDRYIYLDSLQKAAERERARRRP